MLALEDRSGDPPPAGGSEVQLFLTLVDDLLGGDGGRQVDGLHEDAGGVRAGDGGEPGLHGDRGEASETEEGSEMGPGTEPRTS